LTKWNWLRKCSISVGSNKSKTHALLHIISSVIENESKNVRATGYLISAHIDNDGLEITRWPQDINIIKKGGQFELEWRRLEFPLIKFNIPSQQESISLIFSPLSIFLIGFSLLYVSLSIRPKNTTPSQECRFPALAS